MHKGLLESHPGKDIFNLNFRKELSKRKRKKIPGGFEHPFSLIEKAVKLLHIKNNYGNGR